MVAHAVALKIDEFHLSWSNLDSCLYKSNLENLAHLSNRDRAFPLIPLGRQRA